MKRDIPWGWLVLSFLLLCPAFAQDKQNTMSSKEARPAPPLQLEDVPQTPSLQEERDTSISVEMKIAMEEALKRKEYEKVELQLVKLIEQNPQAAPLLTFLGRVFFLDAKPLNSAVAFKKAERLAPLKESDQYLLALCWVAMQKSQYAAEEFQKLQQAYPQNPLYLYWLGRIDYDNYRYEAAVTRFQKALELDPQYVKVYDNLGLCYEMMSDFARAEPNYVKGVQLNRSQKNPSAWPPLNYATFLVRTNRPQEAEPFLKEALGYSSRFALAHYQLGLALEKQKKYPEGLESLKKAAEYDPASPDPHYAMMRVYRQLGEIGKAEAEMKIFQQLKKDQKKAQLPASKTDDTAQEPPGMTK